MQLNHTYTLVIANAKNVVKKEIYILIILVFVGCKKPTNDIVFKKVDSVSNGKITHTKNIRNIEKSKPFKINGIESAKEIKRIP